MWMDDAAVTDIDDRVMSASVRTLTPTIAAGAMTN
jgi:hypothetical protein